MLIMLAFTSRPRLQITFSIPAIPEFILRYGHASLREHTRSVACSHGMTAARPGLLNLGCADRVIIF